MLRQCCAWRAQNSALRICKGEEAALGEHHAEIDAADAAHCPAHVVILYSSQPPHFLHLQSFSPISEARRSHNSGHVQMLRSQVS
jgi:hypothetical protein